MQRTEGQACPILDPRRPVSLPEDEFGDLSEVERRCARFLDAAGWHTVERPESLRSIPRNEADLIICGGCRLLDTKPRDEPETPFDNFLNAMVAEYGRLRMMADLGIRSNDDYALAEWVVLEVIHEVFNEIEREETKRSQRQAIETIKQATDRHG